MSKSKKSSHNAAFSKALLEWYDRQAIDLPWRNQPDAYRVWLSEIMLQQTRVVTVIGYYERFLKAFPTVQSLAAAPLGEVLKQWEGLGYYSRARNLHRAAQAIVNDHNGEFPAAAATLQTLPGIGPYTAAAIASIAFNEPVAALDGNVMRILTRLFDYAETLGTPAVEQQLRAWAQDLLDAQRPGDFNQALMDLGRTVCLPRNPLCVQCPVKKHCRAFKNQTQNLRPVKKQKAPLPTVRAAAAVLRDRKGRVLLIQRPPSGLLGGLWTLPGGNCAAEESFADCLRRVLPSEFGLTVSVQYEIATAQQTFTHFHLLLRAYACEISKGKLKLKEPRAFAWVALDELAHYCFGKADRAILDALTREQPRLFEE
ncbi:MAG: A/G-specific adenine glycosylase [Acidobacteria bacterium]|nr:A/G-specific adenine glycosylase [Acidobacteriota bacterium]